MDSFAFGMNTDLGLDIPRYDVTPFDFSVLDPIPFEAGFGFDSGLGIDINQFDLNKNFFVPPTTNNPADVKPVQAGKGLFSLPSILNMADAALKAFTAIDRQQFEQAEAARQTAEQQKQFWTQYANQSQQNLRDYQYQLDSYYRQADYVERRRQYELMLERQQAQYKSDVAIAAADNFAKQLADLDARFYEEEAKDTIELDNLRIQAEAKAAKVASRGQAGRTVERLKNQYDQQYLANLSNRQITTKFRIADKIKAGEAANVARENQVRQVRYYTPQPVADPVKPLAPLPIIAVEPAPVSGPSPTSLGIELGSIAIDAFNNYQAMQPPNPTSV